MTRIPFRLAIATVLLVLFAAACGGDDDAAADEEESASSTTESVPADNPTGGDDDPPSDRIVQSDANLDLPRTTTYAGVELELARAEWSNATPATYARAEPSIGSDTLLYLELTTRFLPGYPGDDGFMPVRHFAIETAGGTRVPATGVDHLAEVPISTNADTHVVLAFEITEDALDGGVLTYDDATRVPLRLPLTGSIEESPYPLRVEINQTQTPHLATGCEPSPADVRLVAVEWDVDGGVAVDGTKLARGQSSRALQGHRWLRADLEVTAIAGQCGGTFANQETFRLLVDGTTGAPFNVYSLTLEDGEVAPMIFLFEVPLDATDVVLEAGARSSTTVAFPIEVPTLP